MAEFKINLRERLSRFSPQPVFDPHVGHAAVLMPIFERDDKLSFLFTKRTEEVQTHKGQISFPGGNRSPEDASLCATALRETEEEVGVPGHYVEILGRYQEHVAVTSQLVTPFVGFLKEGFPLLLNRCEVESVLTVPLDFFRQTEPVCEYRKRLGRQMPVYFYDYQGSTIWGLTAAILKDFIEFLDR